MFTPKERSAPAPSIPAAMIPGPAPVMTIQPRSAIADPKAVAVRYAGSPSLIRAEPKMVAFLMPR